MSSPGAGVRVAIVTLGSRGDVVPYLRIATALRASGADVLVVTHDSYGALCAAAGVPFAGLGAGLLEARAALPEGQALAAATGMRVLAAAKTFMAVVGAAYWRGAHAALTAFAPTLCVLNTLSVYWHSSLCEALALPFLVAHAAPLVPTGAFAPPLGMSSWRFAFMNRLMWRVSTKMGWALVYRDTVDALRASAGLRKFPHAGGPYALHVDARRTVLLLHSSQLSPPPSDYPPTAHVLGAPGADDDDGAFQPDEALAAFLAAGAPPIAVTLGSMAAVQGDGANGKTGARTAVEVLRLCAQAAGDAGARALLFTDGATGDVRELVRSSSGNDVLLVAGSVPHGWLFARCAAVVCHGGAGTVHAALRAGAPTVVLSVEPVSDQAFWGARLVACQLAPAAFTAQGASRGALAAALQRCVGDAALRGRCAAAARAEAAEAAAAARQAARRILDEAAQHATKLATA
jgi:UDP:flavonoid glycosyltransferase YjiC (YdhE family)